MGMSLHLFSIDAQSADALAADPDSVSRLLDLDDDDDPDVAITDLDKAWHGIHYLLTGSDWEGEPPLNFLLQGGTMLAEEDEEPAPRLLQPDEVREVSSALAAVDEDHLRERFDPEAMKALDIYPAIWDDGPEALDYCLTYFAQLQAFMREAARQQRAVVIFMG